MERGIEMPIDEEGTAMESQASPYIPEAHRKYGLLPSCRKDGTDVFAWPSELDALNEMIAEEEGGGQGDDGRSSHVLPTPKDSYRSYFGKLEDLERKYLQTDASLADAVGLVANLMRKANHKETWSVVRYTGAEKVGRKGLTPGRCYYWPCSPEHPEYEGVIDDEEFTSYLYPCDPGCWEVLEDPTGMASRALAGEADTVDFWEVGPTELDRWAHENGLQAKRKASYSMLPEEDPWGESERDHVEFACPSCGERIGFDAWTKVNVRDDPELEDAVIEGAYCEFTCPSCGYEAHLAHPCLYMNPERGACVYLVAGEQMCRSVEEMFAGMDEDDGRGGPGGSVRRIVTRREDLADKAAALKAGLDDRALELLKLGVTGSAMRGGRISPDDDYVVRFLGMEGDDLVFRIESEGGASMEGLIPRGAYELFAQGLAKSSMADEQPLYVDREWARHASDVIDREGVLD